MYARTFLGEIYVINYIYTRILVSFLQLCCRKREENSMGKTSKQKKTKADKFIMLPTVDFCFKELMQDKKVRKGLIAALLNVNPTEVESTTLMPTILRKRYPEDKYGILDVRVELKNGVQIDLEMQVESYDFWANRSVYYVSKMYTEQIKEGEDYDKLQKMPSGRYFMFSIV